MDISVKKCIFFIASAYTVIASPRFTESEKINAADYESSYEIEINDENENEETYDSNENDGNDTYMIEISDENKDNENKEKKNKTKEKNNTDTSPEDDDPALLSVSRNKSSVPFTVECYGCSDKKKKDGYIRFEINEDSEDDRYFFSLNGGKTFRELAGKSAVINGLGTGTYSICIMRNNDRSALSDIHNVKLYPYTDKEDIDISAVVKNIDVYKDGKISVHINNFDRKEYKASIDGGVSWTDFVGETATFYYLKDGKYTVTVCPKSKKSDVTAEISVTVAGVSHKNKGYISANAILQNPELPTGCEITSLTMLLNHMGYDADKVEMADKYLPKGEYRNSDFNKVFVGDPKNTNAYGCFSQAITTAANSYLESKGDSDKWRVRNITGCSLSDLYTVIDSGHPAVVWGSIDMKEITAGQSWIDPETGKQLTWPAGEHCMLLVGYDTSKEVVYVNDPLKGLVAYKTDIFEKRFKTLGCQAVIIVEK